MGSLRSHSRTSSNQQKDNEFVKYRLLCANIRGLYRNLDELKVVSSQYDIMLISETLVSIRRDVDLFTIENFKTPLMNPRDGSFNFGGLATYIREGLDVTRQQFLECGCCEVMILKISGSQNNFYIFSVYRSPSLDDKIFDCLLSSISKLKFEDTSAAFIFVGDFNSHHEEWLGSNKTDRSGKAAFEFSKESNCDQLVRSSTHEKGGILDLFLTNVPDLCTVSVNLGIGNSDHYALCAKLMIQQPLSKSLGIHAHKPCHNVTSKYVRKALSDENFKCLHDGCGKVCQSKAGLTNHQTRMHTDVKYETGDATEENLICKYKGCGKVCQSKAGLTNHQTRMHTDVVIFETGDETEENLICNYKGCGKVCQSKAGLTNHQTRMHTDVVKFETGDDTEENLICNYKGCGKVCQSKAGLTNHQTRMHTDVVKFETGDETEENLICNYKGCGKVCQSKAGLTNHQTRMHTDVVKFETGGVTLQTMICNFKGCGKVCQSKAGLTNHQTRMHTDVVKFETGGVTEETMICNFKGCGKVCQSKAGLTNHQTRMHTDVVKFETGRSSSRSKNLNDFVEGDYDLICKYKGCGKVCKSKAGLKNHQTRMH